MPLSACRKKYQDANIAITNKIISPKSPVKLIMKFDRVPNINLNTFANPEVNISIVRTILYL